jgi:hypothetical protein
MDLTGNVCKCGKEKQYAEDYDAYYCGPCNVWAEDKCDEPTCEFCRIRPEYPVNETNT